MQPSRRNAALRVLGLVAAAVVVYFAVRRIDLAGLWRSLRTASAFWLAVASLLNIGIQGLRAAYWTTILSPIVKVPLRTMFRYTLSSSAASVVLPARGGEALRVFWLNKEQGVALPVLASGVAFEKLLDATVLVLIVAPLPWLLESRPWFGPIRLAIPVALLALPLAVLVVRRSRQRFRWLESYLHVFESLPALGRSTAWVVLAWLSDLATIAAVLHALALPVRPDAVMLVLLSVNMAVAIPAAPGSIGTFEVGAAFALTTLGVESGAAAAFGLLYHAVQIFPLLVVWGAASIALPKNRPTARGEV